MQERHEITRFNLNLSAEAYNAMAELSRQTGRSMTDLVRLGLGLLRVAFTAVLAGDRLCVVDANNTVKKEFVLPR